MQQSWICSSGCIRVWGMGDVLLFHNQAHEGGTYWNLCQLRGTIQVARMILHHRIIDRCTNHNFQGDFWNSRRLIRVALFCSIDRYTTSHYAPINKQ
jgi:hypothetical protein